MPTFLTSSRIISSAQSFKLFVDHCKERTKGPGNRFLEQKTANLENLPIQTFAKNTQLLVFVFGSGLSIGGRVGNMKMSIDKLVSDYVEWS